MSDKISMSTLIVHLHSLRLQKPPPPLLCLKKRDRVEATFGVFGTEFHTNEFFPFILLAKQVLLVPQQLSLFYLATTISSFLSLVPRQANRTDKSMLLFCYAVISEPTA